MINVIRCDVCLSSTNNLDSSEIWSDKLKRLYKKGTQSYGEEGDKGNITEVPMAQRVTEV